jgi:hypothetical protein
VSGLTASRCPGLSKTINDACFIVKDRNGCALAYVYYEEESGRRSAANFMTRDEARRIAANIVKLPDLLGRPQY